LGPILIQVWTNFGANFADDIGTNLEANFWPLLGPILVDLGANFKQFLDQFCANFVTILMSDFGMIWCRYLDDLRLIFGQF
jgi:hypothetical protein